MNQIRPLDFAGRYGGEACVTFSAGVAQVASSESAQAAVERADQALYRAKQGGRNRVEAAMTPG